jgi:hypothetical protein
LAEQADEMLKSRYNLEFLGIGRAMKERDLENRLVDHLQRFLLELGYGFCFIGRQHRLALGRKEYFVDLLFYHRFLKALVAFDLKLGSFEPEHAGKMDFYLNLLNDREPVLSIAVINRRQHKREPSKDVLGKVTIIRDIWLAEPHRGHLDILASFALDNLVHPQRLPINTFDALHAAWEEIFNVELLNKRFYRELANEHRERPLAFRRTPCVMATARWNGRQLNQTKMKSCQGTKTPCLIPKKPTKAS